MVMVIMMKQLWILLFALFPYLHAQRYPVTLYKCESDHIVVKDNDQDTPFAITLFNLKITDEEGWERTCRTLEHAEHLEMEIDPSSQIAEPLPVYLFADGELLQRTLVRENHAYTLIHNPEYLYEKELLEIEDHTATMAITDPLPETSSSHSNGWLFLLFIFCSWIVTIVMTIHSFRHPSSKTLPPSV